MDRRSKTDSCLLEYLNLEKVNLVGTSEGDWAAINAALEYPELVDKVVADSFDGRTLTDDFSGKLIQELITVREDEMAVEFYRWCKGKTGSTLWIWTQKLWPNAPG